MTPPSFPRSRSGPYMNIDGQPITLTCSSPKPRSSGNPASAHLELRLMATGPELRGRTGSSPA